MVVTLRAASCAEVPKPCFRLDRYLRKRDWIEELEAKYDEAPTFGRRRRKSKGPRCALERDSPNKTTRRGSDHRKRRAQVARARRRAGKLVDLLQPHEDIPMPRNLEVHDALSERQREIFLNDCDAVITMCTAARRMADEELDSSAAAAEARRQLEQEMEALAISDEEDRRLLEELEGTLERKTAHESPRTCSNWADDWRAEAHELRLGLSAIPVQTRKATGSKLQKAGKRCQRIANSSGRVSARVLKRQQVFDAEKKEKQALQLAADSERQAAWEARLAASRTTLLDVAGRRAYRNWRRWVCPFAGPHHGRPEYQPLRSAPRPASSSCRKQRCAHRYTCESSDDSSDEELEIDAAALGLDDATVRLLHELQFRDVRPEDYELLGRLDEQVEKPASTLCTVEQVNKFRLFAVCDIPTQADDEIECSICLCLLEEGDQGRQLPCCANALFHDDCITKWLTQTRNTCPACLHEYSR